MRRLITAAGLEGRVRLRGRLANADFLAELPTALALALPSRNETFGMVYTEALFAGVPILYSRGTGIDGHLDGLDVGIAVPPGDITAIADGLVVLARDNPRFRAAVAGAAPELYRRFNQASQVGAYMADIASGLLARHTGGSVRASAGGPQAASARAKSVPGRLESR